MQLERELYKLREENLIRNGNCSYAIKKMNTY